METTFKRYALPQRLTAFSLSAAIAVMVVVGLRVFSDFSERNLLSEKTTLDSQAQQYDEADLVASPLPSRNWMSVAMQIVKHSNLAPPSAARFYAYVASVYADTLEATGDAGQAGRAAAEMITLLLPVEKENVELEARELRASTALGEEGRKILAEYTARMMEDHYDLQWDGTIPAGEDKWYVRDNRTDKAAMAWGWLPWILDEDAEFDIPPPPVPGSMVDRLEIAKVKYASLHRNTDMMPVVFLWHGTRGFEKGSVPDNVTPAGVWLNILAVEKDDLDDREFARAQKILAQTLADAFIHSWSVKYEHWTQRPSMRIPHFGTVVNDPPFPSYPSGHATISAAAATVLTGLFPEHRIVWESRARDAANSRLVAGIHFDVDNLNGLALGNQVGRAITAEVLPEYPPDRLPLFEPMNTTPFQAFREWVSVAFQPRLLAVSKQLASVRLRPPIFRNVIADAGIRKSGRSRGISWHDFDRDGRQDLALFGGEKEEKARLYRNTPEGFVDVTAGSGLDDLDGSPPSAGVFADYDNDGCADLYLTRTRATDLLLKGNCAGSFQDVSSAAGIADTFQGRGAAWADYDRDGDLDIYVANYGDPNNVNGKTTAYVSEPNFLWRNNGDGTFTDVASSAGVTGGSNCDSSLPPFAREFEVTNGPFKESFQPIWLDYDNDGWPDLFVATDSAVSPIYRNMGDGTFKEATRDAKMCRVGTGMGTSAGDFDLDGDLDIYVTNTGRNFLWRNNGDGTFTEVSVALGVDDPTALGWGTEFLDFDNDGDLDIYVVNGSVGFTESLHNPAVGSVRVDQLYENLDGLKFREVSREEGVTGNDQKEAMGFADYDGNGTLDLFVMSSFQEEIPRHRLYENHGRGYHWIRFELTGTRSNRDAVGTRVTLTAGGRTQIREIVSGSSYISQSALGAHFGLGRTRTVDRVEIRWPSGTVQVLENVRADQVMKITEPDAETASL